MNDIKLYETVPEVEKGFPIKIFKDKNKTLTHHWHEHLEFIYLLSDKVCFYCGGKEVSLKKGETLVVNSNELHYFRSNVEVEYICLIINQNNLLNSKYRGILFNNRLPKNETLKNFFEEMYSVSKSGEFGSDVKLLGIAYSFTAYLLQNFVEESLTENEYKIKRHRLKKINLILDYIHENYNSKMSTKNIAERFYLTESHICRVFKKELGVSPMDYLNSYRIDKASVILQTTDESIADIANKVGFENINYFYRLFKREKNTSPGEYRTLSSNKIKNDEK